MPCGLLPSDVSELMFRDIVPEDLFKGCLLKFLGGDFPWRALEDYEMLLQLDDTLEKRVASTEGLADL